MTNETKVLLGIGLATVAIVIGATLMIGGKPAAETTEPVANTEALVRTDSHQLGPKKAQVTLVEFGDFQCPACGTVHPVVAQLLKDYDGKIAFVFRNFPLPMHPNSKAAANAAEAAGAQGKFFEMHDLLFENQSDWESSKEPIEQFSKYAEELKLDVNKFKEDIASKKYEKKIQKDIEDGYAAEVNSTPTFYINGVKQEGGLPLGEFKSKIDAALTKK